MVEVGLSQVPTLDISSLRRILGISIQLQNQFVLHLTNTLAEVLEKAKNSGDLVDLVRCPAKIKRTKHETFTARHFIWSTTNYTPLKLTTLLARNGCTMSYLDQYCPSGAKCNRFWTLHDRTTVPEYVAIIGFSIFLKTMFFYQILLKFIFF